MALTVSGTPQPYFSNGASQDDSGTNYTQRYLVKFSNIDTASAADLQLAEAQAMTTNGIPSIGDNFRFNRNAYCKSKQAQVLNQDNKPVGVIVTCTFSTIGTDKKDQEEDPLKKRPDITWNHVTEREAVNAVRRIRVVQDGKVIEEKKSQVIADILRGGIAVTNSFGDPPQSFPEKERGWLTWTIVQNLPTYDVAQAEAVLYTVNVEPIRIDGFPIGAEKNLIVQRSATIKYQGKQSYREVTTSGIVKPTHDAQVLDNGPHAYIETSARFKSGIDDGTSITINGQDAIDRLDGKGNRLAKDKSDVFLLMAAYDLGDHHTLGLPQERL